MNRVFKISLFLWLAFALALIIFADHHRTVSINYWLAAHHWLTQLPLYQHDGRGFIYLPQSAVLYTPLTLLPFAWSEILWRVLSIGVFAWGLLRFSELFPRLPWFFLLLTLLALPLCYDSVRNGQMHLFTTGLLLLATAAIGREQWPKAAFLISAAFFLKPTAIVFLLLTAGIFFAETWVYFLFWGCLFMVLPFFTQSGAYVLQQFDACLTMLTTAAHTGHSQDWAQFFNLVSQTGWEMPQWLQTIGRLLAAILCLGWGYYIKKRESLTTTAVWLLMLSMIYLVLFNPRTENNDYMMLTPVLGYCMMRSITAKQWYRLCFLILLALGLTGSYYISAIFAGHRNWSAPLMAALLLGYLLFTAVKEDYNFASLPLANRASAR